MFLAFDGTEWRALPGGLARVLSEEDALAARLPQWEPVARRLFFEGGRQIPMTAADRAIDQMCRRTSTREAFGKKLADFDTIRSNIAWSRIELEQLRLLVLKTAYMMDQVGAKGARKEIAMIKVVVPQTVAKIIDRAIQTHGAGGFTNDFFLAKAWAYARTTQMADGPDEVHTETVAKLELRPYSNR